MSRAPAAIPSGLDARQHARKDFWCARHDVAALQPSLLTIEIAHQTACLENQQTAGGDVPGLERITAEAVQPPCSHIGEVEHRRTTPTHGPGRSQHVLKRGTQFEITSRTANALAQEGVSQTGVTRYAD